MDHLSENVTEIPSDSEFDSFLGEINEKALADQAGEFAESQIILDLTEQLKAPDCPVVCLSYPDGTRNPAALKLFEVGRLDEIPLGLTSQRAIDNEQWLYSSVIDLMRVSSNPNDERFSIVSEGKQQLIATWMNGWQLSFTSNWVSFLRDVLPGGEVTEDDINKKTDQIIEGDKERSAVVRKIAESFMRDYEVNSFVDESIVRERAERYFRLAITIVYDIMSGASIPGGELDYRFKQLADEFSISEATQAECFTLCAKLCDVNFVKP